MLHLYVCIRVNGIKRTIMESIYNRSSQKMKLNQVVDLRLSNYNAGNIRNDEYLRVLSWDLKVFIEINEYIFTVIMS